MTALDDVFVEIHHWAWPTPHRRRGGTGVTGVILWNTVYLERTIQAVRDAGKDIDESLLPHLSPLGWEHINLTGDYIWRQIKDVEQGKFRPPRSLSEA